MPWDFFLLYSKTLPQKLFYPKHKNIIYKATWELFGNLQGL